MEIQAVPDQSETPYLIIAGTSKAGTSSVFRYLADHPDVAPSSFKETRFFLDQTYPLHSRFRYERDGLADYASLFASAAADHLRVEATPDYLYCAQAAQRIATSLPQARVLFLLRDPISRLKSWYLFARQNGKIDLQVSFADYVDAQWPSAGGVVPQHMRALEQGRYMHYLPAYFQYFTPENCRILDFGMLQQNPLAVMQAICQFAGLDAEFFAGYAFPTENKTQAMRHYGLHKRYLDWRYRWRQRVHDYPWAHQLVRWLRRHLEPLYFNWNRGVLQQVTIDASMMARLRDYYREDQQQLQQAAKRYALMAAESSLMHN